MTNVVANISALAEGCIESEESMTSRRIRSDLMEKQRRREECGRERSAAESR